MSDLKNKIVLKQDINFLDKPLWFQDSVTSENGMVWKDIDGYEYRTSYKAPDKVDALILMYLLFRSQQKGFKEKFSLTRYEVLNNCNLPIDSRYYGRLKDSLKRWKSVSIEFQGTFYDGVAYKTIGFGIIDSYRIREEDKKLEVEFNSDWLLMIKKSAFFKYINFDFYKTLKRPVSRRLFEILCKSFHERSVWEIDAVKLGQKLTLSTRKIMVGGVEKEVLYPSTVLIAIKPAVNEINKNALNPDLLKEAKLSSKDAFTVTYTVRNAPDGSKVLQFKKIPVSKLRHSIGPVSVDSADQLETKTPPDSATHAPVHTPEFDHLLKLLQKTSLHLEQTLLAAYQSQGADFVRSNILYANQNAKRSYIAFLKKALAADWAEEERNAQLQAQAEEQEKQKRQAHLKQKLAEIAQAKFVTLPSGKKFKIQSINPEGGLIYEDKGSGTYLQPERVLKCRFD